MLFKDVNSFFKCNVKNILKFDIGFEKFIKEIWL